MTEELTDKEREELVSFRLRSGLRLFQKKIRQPKERMEKIPETPRQKGMEPREETPRNEPWKDFPIDPATGYAVDPNTGAYVDPVTGAVYGESFEGGEAEGENGEDTTEDTAGDTGTERTGTENTGQDTTAGTQ